MEMLGDTFLGLWFWIRLKIHHSFSALYHVDWKSANLVSLGLQTGNPQHVCGCSTSELQHRREDASVAAD